MFQMFKITLVLVLFTHFRIFSQDFSLHLYAQKSQYLFSEPIYLMESLINLTSTEKTIPDYHIRFIDSNIEIIIKGSNGKQLPFSGSSDGEIFWKNFVLTIPPKDSISKLLYISYLFGNSVGRKVVEAFTNVLSPDKYTVTLVLYAKNSDGGKNRKIIAQSNTVEFEVIDPSTQEDIEVYNFLVESVEASFNSQPWENKKDIYKTKLINIIEKFPHNSYTYVAYVSLLYNMISGLFESKDEEIDFYMKKLVIDFPDRFEIFNVLYSYLSMIKKKSTGSEVITLIKGTTLDKLILHIKFIQQQIHDSEEKNNPNNLYEK